MNRSLYSYITAFEVGLCVHKKLLCLVIHIYRYFNVSTMASSAIMLVPFSANNDGGILLHSGVINFNVSTTYFLCVICRRVEMSLLLSDESILLIILFWFLVLSLVIHGRQELPIIMILKVMAALDTISFTSRQEALWAIQVVFKSFSNMTRFLAFLCQTWYQEEQSDPSICSTKFHLGSG